MRLPHRKSWVVLALVVLLQMTATVQVASPAVAAPPTSPAEPSSPAAGTGTPPAGTETSPAGTSSPPADVTVPPSEPPAPTGAAGPTASPTPVGPVAPPAGTTTSPATAAAAPKRWVRPDVVVYGGTPAGVSAAIAAAEQGARVVLVSESATVGGMMSNGISASDIGSALAVQGLAKRFFERIRAYYRNPSTWRFEPRIAERVLLRMAREAGVRVVARAPLRSVDVAGRMIRCARFGATLGACARTFIDASYTGDLIAAAGVPHRLGMEDYFAYPGETLPSRRDWFRLLTVPASEADAARVAFEANPFVPVRESLEPYGQAYGHGTPSVTYRLCVTREAGNKRPFRPAADHAALIPSFRVLAGRIRGEVVTKSNGTLLSDAFHLAVLPGGKYDLNAGRLSLTNLPSPEGYFDPAADRQAVNARIATYVESFFHFVQTDETVPTSVRETFAAFGLCADEFTDNGNWPREPYVREGRRIEGRYTVTEADIFTRREKRSAVALSSYNLDSKLSQVQFVEDTVYRDRGVHSTAPVYEMPYAAMLPAAGGVLNLLAPVGVSASPTAYGSIRMEPQYMALGEAAGVAAALAKSAGRTVASVPVAAIQRALSSRGTLHKVRDVCRRTPRIFRPAGGYTFYCGVLPVAPRALEE